MKTPIRDALLEWAGGAVIGLFPLLSHALFHFLSTQSVDADATWTPDLLFVVITTSGASVMSLLLRLLNGRVKTHQIGHSIGMLAILSVVLLFGATILYGMEAAHLASSGVATVAGYALFASLVTSMSMEGALAARIVKRPRVKGIQS